MAMRIERKVEAGRDDAALIGAGIIDEVEGRRGAKIDDDQITLVQCMRGDGVERAVGADAARLLDIQLDTPARCALPRHLGLDTEIFAAEHLQIMERARNDDADDHRIDIAPRAPFQLEQLVEPNDIFVRRPPRIGRDPPARLDFARLART